MLVVSLLLFFFLLIVLGVANQDTPEPPDSPTTKEEEKTEKEDQAFVEEQDQQFNQVRFNKQCYLVDKMEDLMVHGNGVGGNNKRYRRFSTVTAPPLDITNELVSKKNVRPLLKIAPHQMALLQPKIELFIIKEDQGRLVEIPLPFASELSVGAVGGSLEDMLKSGNFRGAGAGIKSFSYDLSGVNPAEADKLIDAKMTLFFQSINDLFEVRSVYKGQEISFADLINYTQRIQSEKRQSKKANRSIDPKDFRIKAVIGWAKPQASSKEVRKLLPKELRDNLDNSRVVLYLQLTEHTINFEQNGNISIDIGYIAALEQTLESARLDIFWIPEDRITAVLKKGTLEASIKGAASGINTLNSALSDLKKLEAQKKTPQEIDKHLQDALGEDYKKQYPAFKDFDPKTGTAEQARDAVKKQLEARQSSPGARRVEQYVQGLATAGAGPLLREVASQLGYDDPDAFMINDSFSGNKQGLERLYEHLEEVLAHIEKIKRQRRSTIYRRIISSMMSSPGYLYSIKVDPCEVGIYSKNLGVAGGKTMVELREACQANKTDSGTVTRGASKTAKDKEKLIKDAAAQAASSGGKVGAASTTGLDQINQNEITAAQDGDQVLVQFFYLGDLIDSVIDILVGGVKYDDDDSAKVIYNEEARQALNEFNILMGPVVLNDSRRGRKIVANMAEIPISFDLFQQWFLEKVIRPQKVSYLLKDFMRDVVTDLIRPAFGAGCLNGQIQRGRTSMIPLSIPKAGDKSRIPKVGARCNLSQLRGRRGAKINASGGSLNINRFSNYLYFFINDDSTNQRTVNEEQDFGNGIYHLRVGEDAGLVKRIEFTQTDIQFMKEMYITNSTAEKDGFLRAKYDAKITMIGNSLFAPGQYIYVHPTVPGASSVALVTDNLQKLGLGGYYLVTKVFHIVSDEYYQTEITARHEADGVKPGSGDAPTKPVILGKTSWKSSCVLNNAKEPEAFVINDDIDAQEARVKELEDKDTFTKVDNFIDENRPVIAGGTVAAGILFQSVPLVGPLITAGVAITEEIAESQGAASDTEGEEE